MLNVGPLELVVVLAVALIVVGPERLPELARSIGRALRQLRQVQDEVRDMVSMGVDDEMRQAATDFKKATGEIARVGDVAGTARKAGRSVRAGARKATSTTTGTAAAAADRPAGPAPAEPSERTSSVNEGPSSTAVAADTEVAGPPADRLLEDGAGATPEPDASSGEPGGEPDEPTAQP